MGADIKPAVTPLHARPATPSGPMLDRLRILCDVADEQGIGIAGVSAVGITVSLTLAYGSGHAGATRILEALGVDTFDVDDFTVSGRPNYQAVGFAPGHDMHVALWWSEPLTQAELDEAAAELDGA